jgi:hypothetical protein
MRGFPNFVARRVAGPAGRLRLDPLEPGGIQVEPIDKGVNEADRVVDRDTIANRLGKSRSCERSNPDMCVMPNSNQSPAPTESRHSEFSRGLLDICTSNPNTALSPTPLRAEDGG